MAPGRNTDNNQAALNDVRAQARAKHESNQPGGLAAWLPSRSAAAYLACAIVISIVICVVREHMLKATSSVWHQPNSNQLEEVVALTNKPRMDPRSYQYARFANGLQLVNVQDVTAKSSGLAVAVEAGQFLDPKDLPGLAHFCEHMLFLGTKKYPEPSGFDDFLTLHGGASNAYTAEENTVYYANFEQSGYHEAIARFADFFHSPLFDKKFVKKEVHAIDSEHMKNKQSPSSRTYQLMLSLASPKSPVSRFHTGDINTLITRPQKEGINTVAELRKYYKNNYCPSRMRLVTFGNNSLDDQLSEALANFANIDKGNCSDHPPSFASPNPWHPAGQPSRMGQWVEAKSTRPQAELWVMWALPSLDKYYKSHPMSYIQHVLGYGGEGSLMRVLRDYTGLVAQAGLSTDSTSAGTSVWFNAELTHKGRKHPAAVLDLLYAFIAQMKHHGVDTKLYQSLGKIQKLDWDWSEKADPTSVVQDIVDQMTRLPKEDLLTGDYLTPETNATLVRQILDQMHPDNMNIGFIDPNFDPKKEKGVKLLPHYDEQYTIKKASQVLGRKLTIWTQWLSKLDMGELQNALNHMLFKEGLKPPPPMTHAKEIHDIPDNITLDYAKAKLGTDLDESLFGMRPQEFPRASGGSFWFRQGSTSSSPKVDTRFLLRTAKKKGVDGPAPRDQLLVSLYNSLMAEQLGPKTVDLQLTGVSYSLGASTDALSFGFGGFSQNMPALMTVVFNEFQKGVDVKDPIVKARYNRFVEQIRDELQSHSNMPVAYAVNDRNRLLTQGAHSESELLDALNTLKIEEVPSALPRLVLNQKLQYTSLAMGNMAYKDAKSLDHHFLQHFKQKLPVDATLPLKDVQLVTPVVNPQSPVEIRKLNPRPNDPNHVTVMTLLLGVPTIRDRVLYGILGQILGTMSFQELRTKRQLGYVVSGGMVRISNTLGLGVVVQGKDKKPDEVEPLMEWLLAVKMRQQLEEMTDKQFETYKNSFIEGLLEPPLGFSGEIGHYWSPVQNGGQCFDLHVKVERYLNHSVTSKSQLSEAWERAMRPIGSSGMRSKVTVKYFANKVEPRPSALQSSKANKQAGLGSNVIAIATREHDRTLVFSDVNSSSRAQVLADAETKVGKGLGYFSTDLGCGEMPHDAYYYQYMKEHAADHSKTPPAATPAGKPASKAASKPAAQPAAQPASKPAVGHNGNHPLKQTSLMQSNRVGLEQESADDQVLEHKRSAEQSIDREVTSEGNAVDFDPSQALRSYGNRKMRFEVGSGAGARDSGARSKLVPKSVNRRLEPVP